jgi:outer membrane protein
MLKISLIPFLLVAAAAYAQPSKIATIQVQAALAQTKEGKNSLQALEGKFSTRRSALEKKQSDIAALQNQMRAGSATMSAEAKERLAKDFDTKTKELNRENEDYQADVQQDEGQIVQVLGQKMMAILQKYAQENKIAVVVDVSAQGPVLWADPALDITPEIIKRYDEAYPATEAAKPAPARSSAPAPAPPAKKQ